MGAEDVSLEALRRITRALDVYSRTLIRTHNMTGPQLAILKEVSRHGQAPIGMLAKANFLGAPTVTGIVDRLERQGLVSRVRGDEDRRQVLIGITPRGEELLDTNPPLLSAAFCDQLEQLPEVEQKRIREVLQRVARMMEQAVEKQGSVSSRRGRK